MTLQSPFYVELKEGAEAAAKSGGDQLIFLDANGDTSANVGPFDLSALFASYRPKTFSEGK